MFKIVHVSKWMLVFLLFTTFVSAELKIGVINSEKILMAYQGTKEAENKLKKEYARWEQEATERQKKMQEMKEQLDKQSLLLSAERKQELESELQREYIDYNKFLQEKFGQKGDAAKKNDELLRPIIDKINIILDRLAKEENYDFIFDSRGGVVYAKKAYDLTEKVIQSLNSEK